MQLCLKRVAGLNISVLISALIYYNLLIWCVTPKKQFIWLGIAIRKASLIDLMRVIKKFVHCKKIGFVSLMLIVRIIKLVFLDSTCITATKFNHPMEFFSTKCRSNLVNYSILSCNFGSKACVCIYQLLWVGQQ